MTLDEEYELRAGLLRAVKRFEAVERKLDLLRRVLLKQPGRRELEDDEAWYGA